MNRKMEQDKVRQVVVLQESKYLKVQKLLNYMNKVCYGKKKSK